MQAYPVSTSTCAVETSDCFVFVVVVEVLCQFVTLLLVVAETHSNRPF